MASYQCLLRFFHSICVKCCACHEKVMPVARSYEVLHLSRKIILADLTSWCSKMQPFSGDQRPDLLTSLMNMSLVLRLPRKMHLCRSSSNVPRLPLFLKMLQNTHVLIRCRIPCDCPTKPHLNLQKWSEHVVFLIFWLPNVLRATTACTFSTHQLPKVVRYWGVLYILTLKCASRHNGVHFKSGLNYQFFCTFDFEMCFALERRALFRHLNFQKWSGAGVFCTFWLQNVLRATTACTFSTSQLPKVVRSWCVLYILSSKCASRHNGVHFFRHRNFQKWSEPGVFCTFWLGNVLCATTACNVSSLIWPAGSAPAALASLLFDPPEAQIIGKTQCFATFLPFRAPGSSFFWDFLFFDLLSSFFFLSSLLFPSLPFPSLLFASLLFSSLLFSSFSLLFSSLLWLFPPLPFHLSILSEVWLLNFLR